MSSFIPTTIEEVDGPWLSEALGVAVEVVGDPEPLSSFACNVFRLRLGGGPDAPGAVIVKLPTGGELRALIDGLGVYRREVTFYDRIAKQCPLTIPAAYVARIAQERTDFVLVLEDLGSASTADQLAGVSIAVAQSVIDELVRFHAWSWEKPLLDELAGVFPPLDSPAGRAMQEQWGQFFALGWDRAARLAPDAVTPELAAFAGAFASYVPFFIAELSAPRTLTHGELRADNMVFDEHGQVCFIDFQNAQQECGPRELAYFLIQSLTTETRRGNDADLVRRYWDGLQAAGIRNYPFERAWRQYRLAAANQLMMVVIACMRYDDVDERTQRLLVEMMRRGLAAIEDLGALELLPRIPAHADAAGAVEVSGEG